MFTKKTKIGSNPSVIKPESRLFRLIRSDTGFQASLVGLERKDQEDVHNESQKEIVSAMLEAECKKAKAIMMMQQHRNLY